MSRTSRHLPPVGSRLTSIAAVLLIAGTASAQLPSAGPATEKRSWEWTLQERLALRLDPAAIKARQLSREVNDPASKSQIKTDPPESPLSYSIDGRVHPELLLPHEIFESLMTAFTPDEDRRQRYREGVRAGILAAGFEYEQFWSLLSSVTGEYARYKYGAGGGTHDLEEQCRLSAAALTQARQVFGKERFDRFLYEVVAPGIQVASATNAQDPSAELRRMAEGCP